MSEIGPSNTWCRNLANVLDLDILVKLAAIVSLLIVAYQLKTGREALDEARKARVANEQAVVCLELFEAAAKIHTALENQVSNEDIGTRTPRRVISPDSTGKELLDVLAEPCALFEIVSLRLTAVGASNVASDITQSCGLISNIARSEPFYQFSEESLDRHLSEAASTLIYAHYSVARACYQHLKST